jgi:hypothetical protein
VPVQHVNQGLIRIQSDKLAKMLNMITQGVLGLCVAGCAQIGNQKLPSDISDATSDAEIYQHMDDEKSKLIKSYVEANKEITSAQDFFIKHAHYPRAVTYEDAARYQKEYLSWLAHDKQILDGAKQRIEDAFYRNINEIRKVASVDLISKKLVSGEEDQRIFLNILIRNHDSKDIVAMHGSLLMVDDISKAVTGFNLDVKQLIQANSSADWRGSQSIDFDNNGLINKRFSQAAFESFRVVWIPKAIVFADGTSVVVPKR